MDGLVDSAVNVLNTAGQAFCVHAWKAFVQSSVLVGVLLVVDMLVCKRVRAVVRYSIWMLVFVKLVLPPTLSLPTGIGYHWPRHTAAPQSSPEPVAGMIVAAPASESSQVQLVPMAARYPNATKALETLAGQSDVTSVPVSPVAARPTFSWQALVFLGWLAAVVVLSICLARRFQYVRRLVRESVPAPGALQAVLAACAAKLSLRRCPPLRLSDEAPGPVVCRLLRPAVLVPTTLADGMSEDRLCTVLVHELAHIKRADLWVNFVQTLLLVAYFYHPLLWLVNAIVRRLREQAVDETVLVTLDAEARGYSTTLIDLAEMTFTRPILGLRLIGIAESRKALEGRIRHMMTRPRPRTAKVGLWGGLTIAVGAAVLLPMARGQTDVSRGANAISPGGYLFEGKLVFNETLAVDLTAGTAEHPKQVHIESVRFETAYGNAWLVVVGLGWRPVRDATWRLKAELLDEHGQVLRHPWDNKCVFTTIATPDEPMTVRYVDLQLRPMHFKKRRHATGFRLHLEPGSESPDAEGRTMDISVVEPGGRSPVPGAVLVVDRYHETDAAQPRRTLYTTDSQGRCEVQLGAGMLVSPLTIRVQKDGFASMAKVWSNRGPSSASRGVLVNLPQRHVFEMVPATAIGGVVQDVNGALIEGVEVGISAHLDEPSGQCNITRHVRSDADGRWRFEDIPEGIDRVSLRLRHPEFGGDSAYSRQLRDDALREARALKRTDTLERGVRLSGSVFDEGGKPVTGAAVMLLQRGDARSQALSGPRGQFSFACSIERHSLDDAPVVLVEAPGFAPAYEFIDIEPHYAPLEFHLTRGKTITCRVVDGAGEPVVGAWTAVDPLADYKDYGGWLEETDEQGQFQIPNVPDGEIRLTIGKPGFVTKRGHVVGTSQSTITIPLERAVTVQGTVTDATTGKSVPYFEIATVYSMASRPRPGGIRAFAGGEYELSLEEAWSRPSYLRVSAVGYETAMSEALAPGEERQVFDFQLTRASDHDEATAGRLPRQREEPGVRRIAGVVRDEQGTPVSGATVLPVPLPLGTGVITNAAGTFSFTTRPPGTMGGFRGEETLWLLVRHRERNLAAVVRLGGTADDLDITLTDGMSLSGRAVDIDGRAVPDAQLSLAFWPSNMGYGSPEPTEIDADGRFEIRAVPRGYRHSVRAHAEGYGEPSVEVEKDRATRERTELEPLVLQIANLAVSGVVVDELNRPVANVRVSGYGNGQPHRETYADTQGRFTLENMCRGAVALHANAGGSRRMYGEARALGGATDVRIVLHEF